MQVSERTDVKYFISNSNCINEIGISGLSKASFLLIEWANRVGGIGRGFSEENLVRMQTSVFFSMYF